MLSLANSELKQGTKRRYKTGTTDGAGAADGKTLVASALGGVDDSVNEMQIKLTNGAISGERRLIGDYVASSGTITVVDAFSAQVATSVTFEIGEAGVVSDHDLIDYFTEAQDRLIMHLVADAFPAHIKRIEVITTSGVSAALPANLAGPPKSLQFRDASSNEYDVSLLAPSEKDRFKDDAFVGGSLTDMVAMWENGVILVRPTTPDGTLLLNVVPKFDAVTFAGGSKLPSYLHPLQVTWAVYKGWFAKQRLDLGNVAKQSFFDAVNAINRQYTNTTKQTVTEE